MAYTRYVTSFCVGIDSSNQVGNVGERLARQINAWIDQEPDCIIVDVAMQSITVHGNCDHVIALVTYFVDES